MSTNNLTVLILAAGYGRRMGPFSRMINKGLIPYGDKPLISHIIDKFPKETTKFVIACGHMGQQVKDYVGNVHNDKCIVFVDIPDYSEGHTGPATTIRHCSEHLTGGFLWLACDTLFDFDYKSRLDHNWIGVYPVDSTISKDYCWVERDGDSITRIENKVSSTRAVDAFIGLMYAKDDQYLENLHQADAKETFQGFLPNLDLKAHTVRDWLDFGTYEKWQELSKHLPENSFVKPNEIFYHDNNKVVKYFADENSSKVRVERAQRNPAAMPSNTSANGHFLTHDWVKGDIVYNQLTPEIFKNMLDWCDSNLWISAPDIADTDKKTACYKFYKDKTYERLNQFRVKYTDWSECCVVNRAEVDTIDSYLERINWTWLCETVNWSFIHGDLHFDNTIYNPETNQFCVIDWRTDFAGHITGGDMYYDLAKMLGGIWLNYRLVKDDKLEYKEMSDYATIVSPTVDSPKLYEDILHSYAIKKSLDWKKVKTLVPLIYLNMSPLHEYPFDKFLIALAQQHFQKL